MPASSFGLALPRLQRWMQSVVVHPGTVEAALASKEARTELPPERVSEVIRPTTELTSAERLEIYHGMYLLRMSEALEADYPTLHAFLGPATFRRLVTAYVQTHPSRSYTLNRLGDHLPDFIRHGAPITRRGFCHDLARLELAITEVFDAPETASLTEEQLAAIPAESWDSARLRPVAGLRLLALRYPVNDYLQAVKDGEPGDPPTRRKDSWVVVSRRNYAVYHQELSRAAHALLTDLINGVPVGLAVGRATAARGTLHLPESELFRWFRGWTSAGLFAEVELDAPPSATP